MAKPKKKPDIKLDGLDLNEVWLVAADLATILKVDRSHLNHLACEKGMPRVKKGRGYRYSLGKCVYWYMEFLRKQNKNTPLSSQKLELMAAKTERAKLENEEYKKDLISRELLAKQLTEFATTLVDRLFGFVAEAAQETPGLTSEKIAYGVFEKKMNIVLSFIADECERLSKKEEWQKLYELEKISNGPK